MGNQFYFGEAATANDICFVTVLRISDIPNVFYRTEQFSHYKFNIIIKRCGSSRFKESLAWALMEWFLRHEIRRTISWLPLRDSRKQMSIQ